MIDTLGSTTLLAQGFDGADAAAAGGGIIALVILAIELGIAILMIAGM